MESYCGIPGPAVIPKKVAPSDCSWQSAAKWEHPSSMFIYSTGFNNQAAQSHTDAYQL